MSLKIFFGFTLCLLVCAGVWCQEKNSVENAIPDDKETKVKETAVTVTPSLPKTTPKRPTPRRTEKSVKLICPGSNIRVPFFSIPCKSTKECTQLGNRNMVCCNNRCLKGIPPPTEEPVHSPALFGLIERVCPRELLPEFFEIKECAVDGDCSPRICCPEKMPNGETVGYCRTARPKLDRIPVVRPLMEPLKLIMSYMQCTPPPPPFLDLFPKECNNPFDCFPNLCCQERGKRFCRPPRRSLLTLLTTVAQRIVPTETARGFINRIAS